MLLLTFVLIYVFLKLYTNKNNVEVFGVSILAWVMFCFISNEVLSYFKILDKIHLLGVYGILDLILFISIGIKKKAKKNFEKYLKTLFSNIKNNKMVVGFIVFFCSIFLLAIMTIPYNWDSVAYHLPRIMYWAQNKSVAHYATYDIRQLTSPVLAEFVNLQVYLMSGTGDSIFNLLQCFSYITNAVLVYHITKKLDVSKQYCWLSMLLFVSMPIAFGEALSTQVDHFSALFLLIFVYFILDLLGTDKKLSWDKNGCFYVIVLSSCIGLGYLAKPSVLFGMVFLAIWLLIVVIQRQDAIKDIIKLIIMAGIMILLIITPEALRNLETFQAISDPIAGARQLVGTWKPLYLIVNGLKNYAMNLPNIYIYWGKLVEHGVYWIAYKLGVNIHDYSIAEDGVEFYLHSPATYGHDTAINPIVVIFATIAIGGLFVRKIKDRKYDLQDKYSLFAMTSFIFFCIVLRWEPFVTRYMISYLALLCPVVVVWLQKFKSSRKALFITGIVTFVCIVEIINLFIYHGSIVFRQKKLAYSYFEINPKYIYDYEILEETLNTLNFETVGLYISMGMYEYPIWYMLEDSVRVEHVLVDNTTAKYADESFVPEIIIVMNRDEQDIEEYNGKDYSCVKRTDDGFSVWQLVEKKR